MVKGSSYTIKPIGVVHSPVTETKKVPKHGVPLATIEIFDEYLDGLHGLDKFSHIYLLCFFHKSERNFLQIDLDKIQFKYVGCVDPPLGVFAGRSPARPNPVSITIVKIKSFKGNIITVENCDAVDGTPVVDIKPYNGGIDRQMNIVGPTNVPKSFDMKMTWVRRIIENVTGKDDRLTKAIARAFVDAFERGYDYRSKKVKIAVANNPRLVDSAIFLADATFSSGRIAVGREKEFGISFKCGRRKVEYRLRRPLEKFRSADVMLSCEIEELFIIGEKK